MLTRDMTEALWTDLSAALNLAGKDESGAAMAAAATFHHRLEQAAG